MYVIILFVLYVTVRFIKVFSHTVQLNRQVSANTLKPMHLHKVYDVISALLNKTELISIFNIYAKLYDLTPNLVFLISEKEIATRYVMYG